MNIFIDAAFYPALLVGYSPQNEFYMDEFTPTKTMTYLKAEATVPEKLRPVFEQMVEEYRFASFKHHGTKFCSPMVIAELLRMGWHP